MPALLRPGSALQCRPCSRPGSRSFDDSQRTRGGAGAPRRAARRTQAPRTRRIRRAARRPPAERISAGERRTAGLAHRLHRLGRARPSCSPIARRCSSTAAIPCRRRRRSTRDSSPSSIWRDSPPEQWLEQNLKGGRKLGYDPWLHTSEGADRLRKACATAGAELVAVDGNPIDALWTRPPGAAAGPVTLRDRQARRRERRRQAQAHPGRARKAARRCAGGVRPAERRLGLQHPRLGRGAYAAGARLRDRSRARAGRRSMSTAGQARQRSAARAGRDSPTCARRTTLTATLRNSRARPCGSTRRARPTR